MRLTLDTSRCAGAGQCALAAPDVFDHDEEGVAYLLQTEPGDQERAAVEEAIASCPTRAIALIDH